MTRPPREQENPATIAHAAATAAADNGRLLIVTADDFGLDVAVNQAVQQAVNDGILTAASLMVGAPAASQAVQIARATPKLRVGLHLVLVDGRPVLARREIPDLIDTNGRFRDNMVRAGVSFFASTRVRRQLAAEIRAQYAAFAATGLELDHVNAHKHFHLHPTLLDLILQIGTEFGLRAVRVPHEPVWFARQAGLGSAASGMLLRPWTGRMKSRLRRAGVAYNDQVFGVSCSGQMLESTMLAVLARLPEGVTEIYMHPAVATPKPLTTSMATYRHAQELDMLLSVRVRDAVLASRAHLGSFRDLVTGAG